MKKSLAAGLAALTFGGAVMATALPADAQHYRGGYGYGGGRYYGHGGHGDAVAAGVVGLALGAALASSANNHGYYRGGGYGYYDGPRYYRGYTCESSRWVWDPYIGHRVLVHDRYRC